MLAFCKIIPTVRDMLEAKTGAKQCPIADVYCRCGKGEKMFHVETTAWEGEHAYEALAKVATPPPPEDEKIPEGSFATYGNYFWPKN